MIKVAWIIILTLFVVSATGIIPSSIGMFFTPIAIILAMLLFAITERRKLSANLKPGEIIAMPKLQKIILAIFVVLVFAFIFIGGLTKQ